MRFVQPQLVRRARSLASRLASLRFATALGGAALGPTLAGPPAAHGGVAAAVTWMQIAFLVPAGAFFFAFVSTVFFKVQRVRGLLLTALLYLVCAISLAATVGVMLSGYGVEITHSTVNPRPTEAEPNPEPYVVDHIQVLALDIAGISFFTNLATLLVFCVTFVEVLMSERQKAKEEFARLVDLLDPDDRLKFKYNRLKYPPADNITRQWEWLFGLGIGVFAACALFGWLFTHAVLRSVLFAA